MGSLSAQPDNSKRPMVFSRVKKTHDGLGGDLMGDGASSEAGCSLVSVWVREGERESQSGMRRGEERGKGYASLPSRDKGGPGCMH